MVSIFSPAGRRGLKGKMMSRTDMAGNRDSQDVAKQARVPFSSNPVRLSPGEWVIVAIVGLVVLWFGPKLWERLEKLEPGPDYRMPYELGSDYWLYRRWCRRACSQYDVLVVGDSVIWGHYVSRQNTLSHYLNEVAGRDRFANLGVDGIHPIALEGLLRHYAPDITGKTVLLHFNPLWMSSKKHDLQTEKEFSFNHPQLVPQFRPNIPCYRASFATRISAVLQRHVSLFALTSHLRKTYFDNMDVPRWTLEHPHANPLRAITLELPASDSYSADDAVPWIDRGTAKADFQWVEPDTSLQWRFFQRAVERLRARGNTVFVLVGPFNEHMTTAGSLETYRRIKSEIELWLQQNDVPYYIPPALPSRLYVDASHPLSEGYALLAKELLQNPSFQ
jgi:hypothetical protein